MLEWLYGMQFVTWPCSILDSDFYCQDAGAPQKDPHFTDEELPRVWSLLAWPKTLRFIVGRASDQVQSHACLMHV